jgi:adenosylcobinamide-GDP ribazoletransferase
MSILVAFRFLTILPVPLPRQVPEKAMGRAVAWYPLVGLVIGGLLAGADRLLGPVFPVGLRSALVLAGWVALTGALHLDGFMDCCDALLAPRSPEERLEILRDVHAGSFAVAGAVLLLLVKYVALSGLEGWLRTAVLIGAPVLGRWAMALAVVGYPYARPGPGLGRLVKEGAGRQELAIATVVAAGGVLVAWRWLGLIALPLTAGLVALVARAIMARIPGLTGDAYGAINEVVEAAVLVVVAGWG